LLPCTCQCEHYILDLPSQSIANNHSIYILKRVACVQLYYNNTGHYFKLLTRSLDRSPFVGETYLIFFVAELRSYTQTRFTSSLLPENYKTFPNVCLCIVVRNVHLSLCINIYCVYGVETKNNYVMYFHLQLNTTVKSSVIKYLKKKLDIRILMICFHLFTLMPEPLVKAKNLLNGS